MYQYTNHSVPTYTKETSYHSLPDTYYPSQPQQNYGWYTQQPLAASSTPVLTTNTTNTGTPPSPPHTSNRPKITTSLWEDEGTICYQVDARGICVARRQDNDMVNGTKLLNVTGMSRGKRDGILKNEKGRVVVKVGAMHLKGVWVTFSRAKALAIQHNIKDVLHPLFVDDPSIYFYSNPMAPPHANYFIPTNQMYLPQASNSVEEIYSPHRHAQQQIPSSSSYPSTTSTPSSSMDRLPPTRSVPSMMMSQQQQQDYYAYREPNNNNNNNNQQSLQDYTTSSVDHLDQHSLIDYSSKGSSSMFSLTVSDSSPATPSQQSLFYDSTMTTNSGFPPSPHSYSMEQQQIRRPSIHNDMMDLPSAPTLPSNTSLDSSFYYTHPCVSTTSFHDHLSNDISKLPSSSSCSFHQATMDFYGSYTPSSTTHYSNTTTTTQSW